MHVKQGNSSKAICFSKCFIQFYGFKDVLKQWEKLKNKEGRSKHIFIIGLQFKMTINFFKIPFQNSQNVITKETRGFAK